jgi:hypothetical protein
MAEVREVRRLPCKEVWVTYGLQGLSTDKFLEVVKKILEGKYILLKPPETGFEDYVPTEGNF